MVRKKENKGVTLIALVVTIIILLILAGVSISMLTGKNGILKRANEAKEETARATEDEQRKMAMFEAAMNTELMYFQNVPIPAGFAPTRIAGESTVEEGLVIIDSEGNEFVWIPVEDSFSTREESLNDNVKWEKEEYNEMKESVEKYKGFYIGRYEAGSTTERKGWQTNGNGTTKMVVQRDQYPYVYVGWGKYDANTGDYSEDIIYKGDGNNENNGKGAVYLCRHMYDGKSVGVKSTLCYGTQWDAMINYIKKSDLNVEDDSKTWGNYYGLEFKISRKSAKKQLTAKNNGNVSKYEQWNPAYGKFGASDISYLLTTGATDRNKAMNLYDIAGNCLEVTMEVKVDGEWRGRWRRGGGAYKDTNNYDYANSRVAIGEEAWGHISSFRPTLYLVVGRDK